MPNTPEQIKHRRSVDPEYVARLRSYTAKYRIANIEKERERDKLSKAAKREADREAHNAYMREWLSKNKETVNAKRREARLANPEKTALDNARRKAKHDPIHHRDLMLRNNYGIGLEDYKAMYVSQNGKCAICDTHCPDHGKMGLVVDHCHKKGHVRKLLCTHCNKGIGQFKENTEILLKAIEYLKRF